jgi:hypothetical protein
MKLLGDGEVVTIVLAGGDQKKVLACLLFGCSRGTHSFRST